MVSNRTPRTPRPRYKSKTMHPQPIPHSHSNLLSLSTRAKENIYIMLPTDAFFILNNQQNTQPSPTLARGGFWERVRRYSFGARNDNVLPPFNRYSLALLHLYSNPYVFKDAAPLSKAWPQARKGAQSLKARSDESWKLHCRCRHEGKLGYSVVVARKLKHVIDAITSPPCCTPPFSACGPATCCQRCPSGYLRGLLSWVLVLFGGGETALGRPCGCGMRACWLDWMHGSRLCSLDAIVWTHVAHHPRCRDLNGSHCLICCVYPGLG